MTIVRFDSAEEAVAWLRKAVEARGADFVYPEEWKEHGPRCVYFRADGSPACIVGEILHLQGVTLQDIQSCNSDSVEDLAWAGWIEADDNVLGILSAAQLAQDQGYTWGEALRQAETLQVYRHDQIVSDPPEHAYSEGA